MSAIEIIDIKVSRQGCQYHRNPPPKEKRTVYRKKKYVANRPQKVSTISYTMSHVMTSCRHAHYIISHYSKDHPTNPTKAPFCGDISNMHKEV